MQAAQKIDKWSVRSKIGAFLGMSPKHARSVEMILNIQTGHVSPQFHWKADSTFTTVLGKFGNASPKSQWQQDAGFIQHEGVKSS
jgi:hypothetical protein